MAPYKPPVSHYTEMDVSNYDEDTLFSFIGKSGKRFYWLTRLTTMNYMWYDKSRKIIELWGPYESLVTKQAQHIITCELDNFIPKSGVDDKNLRSNVGNNVYTSHYPSSPRPPSSHGEARYKARDFAL